MTRGAFERAVSFPFKVWCLSTFPFPCPWQSTHTYNMSCPQNTWLGFISPKSLPYAKYPIHLNRRIIGVGGSLAQTIAVIKPSVHERFVGSARHIKDGRCCSGAIYTHGVTPQTLLPQYARRVRFPRERRAVEDECPGQARRFGDNRTECGVKPRAGTPRGAAW